VTMAKAYEDIGKEAIEFITKGFPNSGTFKVSTETKTPNGVSVKSTATRSFDFKEKDVVEEKLSGEIEPKFEWKEHDLELSGKLATGGDFEGGVTFNNLLVSGGKVSFTGIQSDKDGAAVKANVAYKNPQVSVKAGTKFPFKTATHVNYNGEVTLCHEKFFVGTDVRYDQAVRGEVAEDKQPKDRQLYNVRGGYIENDLQFIAALENQLHKDKKTVLQLFNLNFLYSISNSLKFGFGFSVERNNVKGTEGSAAVEYKADKDTVFKTKFAIVNAPNADDREFRFGVACKQNVSERVNVTVGADINARALLGAPGKSNLGTTKPHSFGFEVKFA